MTSMLSGMLSIEGKGLRNKLTIISLLLVVLPFMVFLYILYLGGLFSRFSYIYIPLLFLSLSGLIILRQVFDRFITVNLFMKKAEAGELVTMEVVKDTAELHEIAVSFNGIVKRLEDTSDVLEEQTLELKEAVVDRIRAGEMLKHRVEMERLISDISADLSFDKGDNGISDALRMMGEITGVDRSYIFLLSNDKTRMYNTYEWCAGGIDPQVGNFSVDSFPWLMGRLNLFETINIPDVSELHEEARAERNALESQAVQSIAMIPLVYGGSLIGFLGLDSIQSKKTWPEEDIGLLRVAGDNFAMAIEHKRAAL